MKFRDLGINCMIIRFGLILDNKEGALPQFANPIQKYVGSLLGSGKQWYSWIHKDDLTELILFGIKQHLSGIYNGVAPHPKRQNDFLRSLAKTLNRKIILPRVPTWALRLVLGEMHHLVTDSQRVSASKIQDAGFVFKHTVLREAFEDLYKK